MVKTGLQCAYVGAERRRTVELVNALVAFPGPGKIQPLIFLHSRLSPRGFTNFE